MEIISNMINNIYSNFLKKEEPIYTFSKYKEPTNDEIDELINATIREIKLDNEINNLNIRLKNLIKEDDDNQSNNNNNDKNNGAIQERIKVLIKNDP